MVEICTEVLCSIFLTNENKIELKFKAGKLVIKYEFCSKGLKF